MKMNIFGREADFDQLAIATPYPKPIMDLLGGEWSKDHTKSRVRLPGFPEEQEIEFKLFYNYEQNLQFKELELIQFLSHHNFHSLVNKTISPLGLYAPALHQLLSILKKRVTPVEYFISHIGIHCSEEEAMQWRLLFLSRGINAVHEDTSYSHTNPVIAGKRTYHNIIFGSREAIGFDFKACIRINSDGT